MEFPQYFANTKSSHFTKKELGHERFQLPTSVCFPFGLICHLSTWSKGFQANLKTSQLSYQKIKLKSHPSFHAQRSLTLLLCGACCSGFSMGRLSINHWNKGRSGIRSSLLYKKVLFCLFVSDTYILSLHCQVPWFSLQLSNLNPPHSSPGVPNSLAEISDWEAPPCCEFRCVLEVLYPRLCPDLSVTLACTHKTLPPKRWDVLPASRVIQKLKTWINRT